MNTDSVTSLNSEVGMSNGFENTTTASESSVNSKPTWAMSERRTVMTDWQSVFESSIAENANQRKYSCKQTSTKRTPNRKENKGSVKSTSSIADDKNRADSDNQDNVTDGERPQEVTVIQVNTHKSSSVDSENLKCEKMASELPCQIAATEDETPDDQTRGENGDDDTPNKNNNTLEEVKKKAPPCVKKSKHKKGRGRKKLGMVGRKMPEWVKKELNERKKKTYFVYEDDEEELSSKTDTQTGAEQVIKDEPTEERTNQDKVQDEGSGTENLLAVQDIKQEVIPPEEIVVHAPFVAASGEMTMEESRDFKERVIYASLEAGSGQEAMDESTDSDEFKTPERVKRKRKAPKKYEATFRKSTKKPGHFKSPTKYPCLECYLKHDIFVEGCPFLNSVEIIKDNVIDENRGCNTSYRPLATLPFALGIKRHTTSGFSVFASYEIQPYTQFGPVCGKEISYKEVNADVERIPFLWIGEVVREQTDSTKKPFDYVDRRWFIDTSKEDVSNWCRFLRTFDKGDGEQYNMIAVRKAGKIFLVTTCKIKAGEELLYHIPYIETRDASAKFLNGSTCTFCRKDFQTVLDAFKHFNIFHRPKREIIECDICAATFVKSRDLKEHCSAEHGGKGAFQCEICGNDFLLRVSLRSHIARCHGDKVSCEECDFSTFSRESLRRHMKEKHSNQPDYLCPSCPKKFRYYNSLHRHLMIHDDMVNLIKCDQCGKGFRDHSNLKVHMLTHTGEKPWKCRAEGCDAAYTTKQCLQKHVRASHPDKEESELVVKDA